MLNKIQYFIVFTFRFIILTIYWVLLCTISCIVFLPRIRDKRNLYAISAFVKPLLKSLYGIKTYILQSTKVLPDKAVYISNHQNTLDIVTLAKAIQPDTLTVGKKQLARVPFFGWMYWITGNILLDKNQARRASETIAKVVDSIKKDNISVWLFPEGTRSYGRYEIGQFKSGAFVIAIEAGVPIVPVVVSNLNNFKLGNYDNGEVIIKYLEPINTKGLNRRQAKDLALALEKLFLSEYRLLNQKVAEKDFANTTAESEFTYQDFQEWIDSHPEYKFPDEEISPNQVN